MESKYKYPLANEETHAHGGIIFKEGGSGDWVYVVLSGFVEISRKVDGRKHVLGVLEPGDLFGETEFLGGMKRTVTAQCVGETTIGVIDRDIIEKEYSQLSGQFRGILKAMSQRYERMLDKVCELSVRADSKFPQVLSLVYKDRRAFLRAYSASMSTGGLFINTEKLLPVGHRFLLKLQLPDLDEPLRIKSEVIWARKREEGEKAGEPGMGIKFREISRDGFKRLREYLGGEANVQKD